MEDKQGLVVCRKHHLLLTIKLPAQKVILSSVENKKQLIHILFEALTQDMLFNQQTTGNHALFVTCKDPY